MSSHICLRYIIIGKHDRRLMHNVYICIVRSFHKYDNCLRYTNRGLLFFFFKKNKFFNYTIYITVCLPTYKENEYRAQCEYGRKHLQSTFLIKDISKLHKSYYNFNNKKINHLRKVSKRYEYLQNETYKWLTST